MIINMNVHGPPRDALPWQHMMKHLHWLYRCWANLKYNWRPNPSCLCHSLYYWTWNGSECMSGINILMTTNRMTDQTTKKNEGKGKGIVFDTIKKTNDLRWCLMKEKEKVYWKEYDWIWKSRKSRKVKCSHKNKVYSKKLILKVRS